MTGNRPYHNEASQHQKRAITANDRRVRGLTFHNIAVGESDMVAGRWATESKTNVVGSGVE
jgi:hypothetical protein